MVECRAQIRRQCGELLGSNVIESDDGHDHE